MFSGCTNLVNAPDLPATTLANYCYNGMFEGCTSLVNAPALPVTSLADYCYENMFKGCTSLVNAPALPATSLADGCYKAMFYNCTSLKYLNVSFEIWGTQTDNWVENVNKPGIFVCPELLAMAPGSIGDKGVNMVPFGFIVENP
jgi:hypothetical protein